MNSCYRDFHEPGHKSEQGFIRFAMFRHRPYTHMQIDFAIGPLGKAAHAISACRGLEANKYGETILFAAVEHVASYTQRGQINAQESPYKKDKQKHNNR